VGRAADVPRALEHPAIGKAGQIDVIAAADLHGEDENVAADARTVERLLERHRPDTILFAGPVGRAVMRRITDLALVHHCRLLAVMPTEVLPTHAPVIVWEGERPLVQLARRPWRPAALVVKRAMDVTGALLGLLLIGPVLLVLAALVRLESPGAPFFAHERVGLGGRRFRCWKLRTMRDGAEAELHDDAALLATYRRNDYKLPDDYDPRVTPLGRMLRRFSLDELPQLWNVLVGDMSLVGPRPVVPAELEHFAGAEDLILTMPPGITGLWAVNGRHHVSYPERAELELRYVRDWSLGGDIRILARTPRAVFDLSGESAPLRP
jgi:lipopolysaccharide/colanic/teichoic acid biosynthesis glycosyltransferase